MVRIRVGGKEVHCERGENLREVLVRHELLPAEDGQWGLCKGTLQCGTCMVRITGEVKDLAQSDTNSSPIYLSGNLRRSCRISIQGDLDLK